MRPAVGAAILLLVVTMFLPNEAVADVQPQNGCGVAKPCSESLAGGQWYQLNPNNCMRVFKRRRTHNDAEKICVESGGHLISIHTEEQLRKVSCAMQQAESQPTGYWIGLRKRKGEFVWSDGSQLDFLSWGEQQPDNVNREQRCVEMNSLEFGKWSVSLCKELKPFVCKVKIN